MNKTIATIGVIGALAVGAVAGGVLTNSTDAQTLVEKVDSTTIKVTLPQNFNIKELKSKLKNLKALKQEMNTRYQNEMTQMQTQIDDLNTLIDQATAVGVQ